MRTIEEIKADLVAAEVACDAAYAARDAAEMALMTAEFDASLAFNLVQVIRDELYNAQENAK